MAHLNIHPGTSTQAQHKCLFIAARDHGISRQQLHHMLGVESLKELSVKNANVAITKLTGQDLPHPPGAQPPQKCGSTGAIRMITSDQIEQINRLTLEYFRGNHDASNHWLRKNFKVEVARRLATARRAGQVIKVLKEMCARKH